MVSQAGAPLLVLSVMLAGCGKNPGTASGADPRELIHAGWTEYTLSEFDRAVARFDEAVAVTQPDSDLQLQALYGLATTWNLRRPGEDVEKARGLYAQIIQTAPQHDLAAWSQLALARMKHLVPVGEEPDYDEVRQAYREVIDKHPGHLAATEAFIYQMSMLVSSLKIPETKQALKQLEEFVKNPDQPFIGPAYSLMAVSYTTLGDQGKRLQAEIESLNRTEVDPQNPFTEFTWQYWNIATIAEFEVGDFDTARVYYQKLIDQYPTDIHVFGCKRALMRMDELEQKIREEM